MDTLLLIASLVLPQVHIRFKLTQRIFLLVLQEPSPSQNTLAAATVYTLYQVQIYTRARDGVQPEGTY